MSENADKNNYTTEDWIKWLKQQAEKSREYRHKLYEKVDLANKENILDVGCGTGALTLDLAQISQGNVVGVDIDPEKLEEANRALSGVSNVTIQEADACDLPFDDETFDLVHFQLVLMHIKDQQKAIIEMVRVLKPGGILLAALEPDYAGRFSYPEDPADPLVLRYIEGLGADLYAGRKLKVLLNNAGLKTTIGMDTETEYLIINDDDKLLAKFENQFWTTRKVLKSGGWNKEQIEKWKRERMDKIKKGLSFGFLPCFYAIGEKQVI